MTCDGCHVILDNDNLEQIWIKRKLMFFRKMSDQNNDPKWKVEKERILSLSLEERRKVCSISFC